MPDRKEPPRNRVAGVSKRSVRFSDAGQAAHVGLWFWNVKSDVLVADRGMQKLLGVAPDAVAGTRPLSLTIDRFSDRIRPEERAFALAAGTRAWREGSDFAVAFGLGAAGATGRTLLWRGGRVSPSAYELGTIGGSCSDESHGRQPSASSAAVELDRDDEAIARLTALGHRSTEVAGYLGLTRNAVVRRKRQLAERLGIEGRQADWVQQALKRGWFLH